MKKHCLSFSMILILAAATSCTPAARDKSMRDGTVKNVATVGGAAAGAAIDKNNRGRGAVLGAAAGNFFGGAAQSSNENNKNKQESDKEKDRVNSEPSFKIPGLPSSSPIPGIFQ